MMPAAVVEDAEGEGAASDEAGGGAAPELGASTEGSFAVLEGTAVVECGAVAVAASDDGVGGKAEARATAVAAAGGGSGWAAQRHSSSTGSASENMPTKSRPRFSDALTGHSPSGSASWKASGSVEELPQTSVTEVKKR